MRRFAWSSAAAFLAFAAPAGGQTLAEVCGRLGSLSVGQWAEYSIRVPQGGEVGGFRFAILESESREGRDLYWFENYYAQGFDERVTHVLVPGYPYENSEIAAGRMRIGPVEPADMSNEMLMQLRVGGGTNVSTPIAESCDGGAELGWEAVTVPAGVIEAIRVRVATVDVWLSAEVPFGVVRLTPPDGSSEVVLTRHGTGAESWLN